MNRRRHCEGGHAWVGGPSQEDDDQSDAEHDGDADELQPDLQPPAIIGSASQVVSKGPNVYDWQVNAHIRQAAPMVQGSIMPLVTTLRR